MNYSRTKKARPTTETRATKQLARAADKLLEQPMTFHEAEHDRAERYYFRSVGSVMQRNGVWAALDGSGNVLGEFPTRVLAWQVADRCGIERAGILG